MASDFNMMPGIKAFFQAECNHAFGMPKYPFPMTYGSRLQKAMTEAGVDRKTVARKVGITVQALGQVLAGKTKALAAEHHTRAAIFLRCDPLWLAVGGARHPAATRLEAAEPGARYDHLPPGLTTAERDLVESFRLLPTRRQAELRDTIMAEARQHLADYRELAARHGATSHADPDRVAEALPVRPDGEQPNTEPGTLN